MMFVPYLLLIILPSVLILMITQPMMTSATSHWIVTEQGKIQAQVDSIFVMKRPYDLVSFMQQEERAEILNKLKTEMSNRKFDEDIVETSFDESEMDMQKKFFETNSHCRKAKMPLAEFDLYVSTVILPEFDLEEILRKYFDDEEDDYDDGDEEEKPFCSHLSSNSEMSKFLLQLTIMINKAKVKMAPEDGLANTISINNSYKVFRYAKAIKKHLNEDKFNWMANFYASNYWRVVGNADEALTCLRNAIVFAPEAQRHIGLLGLANICHRTHFSDEAISVLQKAIEYSPDKAALHFTLGNVYATMMQFNQSAESYKKALEIKPKFQAAKARRHGVICHENLERMLQRQHSSLQETLEELRRYKKQHDTWATVLSKILSEQASPETRTEVDRSYERLRLIFNNKPEQAQVPSVKLGQNFGKESDKKLIVERMLQMFEKKIEAAGISDEKDFEHSISVQKSDLIQPTLPLKYESWPPVGSEMQTFKEESDDQGVDECTFILSNSPRSDYFPTVFISPENRGFDVAKMFSDHVNIPIEHPAALPWFPPLCKSYVRPMGKYDSLKTFDKIRRLEIEVRSTAEKDVEIEYSLHSPVNSFHEWGARINAALKQTTHIPEWITYLYAGTYWRIWGHPQNCLDCYKHALTKVPKEYLDIVLTNLAGLLYKVGSVDDAIVLLQDAIGLNDREPGTNFFLANMFTIKANSSGAIHHYNQVLRMIPNHSKAEELLQVAHCQAKFNAKAKANVALEDACSKDLSPECLNQNSLTRVPGMDAMIYCKDGQCKFVNPTDLLVNQSEDEITISEKKPSSKRSAHSKKKKKLHESKPFPPILPAFGNEIEDFDNPSTTTLLMARDEMKNGLPQGAVEIGTIAETEPDEEEVDDETKTESQFVSAGPVFLQDDPMPDVLVSVRPDPNLTADVINLNSCDEAKSVNWLAFTSTWLSVSAKGIDIREYLGDYLEVLPQSLRHKPICEPEVPNTLLTMDHLTGIRMRGQLHLASEAGLKEAFLGIVGAGDSQQSMDETATRISLALKSNQTSWVLTTAAALYWRVKGNTEQAIKCLRHSLYHAPRDMRDIPLISLSNVFHRAGLYHDALITANAALEISPKFVVVHFTIGNIYASMGDFDNAANFYLSTLALQSSFDPARDRLLSLYCDKKLTIDIGPKKKFSDEL